MRRTQGALLAATLTVLATACGGGSSQQTKSADATTSTTEATTTTTTTAGSAGSGSTVAPPHSTPTTSPPAPATTRPPAPPRPPAGTGVFGTVSAGPTCPVARAEQPCDPRPIDTAVEARSPTGAVVATTHTDSTGGYHLRLAPATYTLVATTGSNPLPRCTPTTVEVTNGKPVQANIACDTGIR